MNVHNPLDSTSSPLLAGFLAVRAATERLAERLSVEDQNLQSMPDASPVKWHCAHTTWFFENFLLKQQQGYREFHPAYSYLFNSYYDAVGARHARPQRGLLSRPSVEEIGAYRRYVDEAVCELLSRDNFQNFADLIELGINHEQQHQELILTDTLHAFAKNPLKPAYAPFVAARNPEARPLEFDFFEGGLVDIGHDGNSFAFDNECPKHPVMLAPFRLANRLTTNREWLEFIEADGYRDPRHWLSDGWQYVVAEGWQAPLYWERHEGQWRMFSLAGLLPLDPDAPVTHISFYEADAFARWRGKRLPTEFEWEHAAKFLDPGIGNFADAGYFRPMAAGGSPQMFGDVWEWTGSAYAPYPGYRVPEGAVGEYNGKFMVNQMVLRGGSCATPRGHVRATYRNFFYPHQRWQFSGLRLAEDAPRAPRDTVHASREASPFLRDVLAGLSRAQKQLNSKYLYDSRGSELFEEICRLPEYYLTRTECGLLADLALELGELLSPDTALVEFGCGSCQKTRILLSRIRKIGAYAPIDICGYSLGRTAADIARDCPELPIRSIVADFMAPISLPEDICSRPILGFFPGSTIGNFTDDEANAFLRRARTTLGDSASLLIGIDLVKDIDVLLAAYDDAAGITAAFNKNVLVRINRELSADFDLHGFAHRAIWNEAKHRIEMHLESTCEQNAHVGGREFHFGRGETVQTENCHKYEIDSFALRASQTGWALNRAWMSETPKYAVLLLS